MQALLQNIFMAPPRLKTMTMLYAPKVKQPPLPVIPQKGLDGGKPKLAEVVNKYPPIP